MEPVFDDFGDLPEATFGGSGIPTDPTAITTITSGGNTITLGLTAHQRFSNPPLTNDGAGTFFAGTGANDGTPGNPGTAAKWNFAWFIDITGGDTFADFAFSLLYDFDPGADTDASELGVLDFTDAINASDEIGPADVTTNEGSQNLTFRFLADPSIPGITASAFRAFDPIVPGEYSFALLAADGDGEELGRSAIDVQAVPLPGPLALLGLGLAGLGLARRRRL